MPAQSPRRRSTFSLGRLVSHGGGPVLLVLLAACEPSPAVAFVEEANAILRRRAADSAHYHVLDSLRAERDSLDRKYEDSLLTLRVRVAVLEAEAKLATLPEKKRK
jgi:hypothetical protein